MYAHELLRIASAVPCGGLNHVHCKRVSLIYAGDRQIFRNLLPICALSMHVASQESGLASRVLDVSHATCRPLLTTLMSKENLDRVLYLDAKVKFCDKFVNCRLGKSSPIQIDAGGVTAVSHLLEGTRGLTSRDPHHLPGSCRVPRRRRRRRSTRRKRRGRLGIDHRRRCFCKRGHCNPQSL